MKIAFKTLGCRLNQYETDSLITRFINAGYEIVGFKDHADVYVINTCTVTSKSDYKSRNAIKKSIRKNQNAITIVTGCYAVTDKNVIAEIPGVDYVISNEEKLGVFELVEAIKNNVKPDSLEKSVFDFPAPVLGFHTRAYLKIQDGCNNFCSYCKVPYARGREKSKNKIDIINEFRELVESGIKEIILTGVNLGAYKEGIENVLTELLKISADFRIHLSSIEMFYVTDKLLELMRESKMCYHLHIPLQSGSDVILKKMNRKYTAFDFLKLIDKIRKQLPDINLTSDVIVGFPGENDKDFQKTKEIIEHAKFSHVHTFTYSPRKGTAAYDLNQQIPKKIKSERSRIIRNISRKQNLEYKKLLTNKKLWVLIERKHDINGEIFSSGKTREYVDISIADELEKHRFYDCVLKEPGIDFSIAQLTT